MFFISALLSKMKQQRSERVFHWNISTVYQKSLSGFIWTNSADTPATCSVFCDCLMIQTSSRKKKKKKRGKAPLICPMWPGRRKESKRCQKSGLLTGWLDSNGADLTVLQNALPFTLRGDSRGHGIGRGCKSFQVSVTKKTKNKKRKEDNKILRWKANDLFLTE